MREQKLITLLWELIFLTYIVFGSSAYTVDFKTVNYPVQSEANFGTEKYALSYLGSRAATGNVNDGINLDSWVVGEKNHYAVLTSNGTWTISELKGFEYSVEITNMNVNSESIAYVGFMNGRNLPLDTPYGWSSQGMQQGIGIQFFNNKNIQFCVLNPNPLGGQRYDPATETWGSSSAAITTYTSTDRFLAKVACTSTGDFVLTLYKNGALVCTARRSIASVTGFVYCFSALGVYTGMNA
jgi:hypothetical protein